VWTDPSVDWAAAGSVVVRAVFDYVRAREEFCAWAERVASVTRLHNPADVLRWNSHKSYLRDLEAGGIPIVPTAWLDAGSSVDLAALLAERGWPDAVVKAAVDNGARGALRVSGDDPGAGQAHVEELLQARDVMVQPYVTATEDVGEHALVHIDGVFSHAVRKDQMLAGRPFDLNRIPRIEPDPRELALAERVLARFDDSLLYARVDTICAGDDVMLMELEVLEPVLFFSKAPGSADRMAAAINRRA
jgi:glutathione synthase/RimK-type ligase-like ATP-grasp enzyme